ncbi:hypothetical protein HPB47_004776, partial [Ixodes persulcatus]
PLFLYLSHLAPHSGNRRDPLQVPKKFSDRYHDIGSRNRTLYAGMVSALDESVGAVVEALGRRGMLADTVLVFSSDNGANTKGDNPNYASSWPFKGQKITPWEGGVRAPAIIWSPSLSGTQGRDYSNIFHISDWLPTLYQLAAFQVAQAQPAVGGQVVQQVAKGAVDVREHLTDDARHCRRMTAQDRLQIPPAVWVGKSAQAHKEDGADHSSSVYFSFAMKTASSSISQNKASRFLQDSECTSIASLQRYDAVRQAFVRNSTLPSSASVEVAADIFTKKRGKMSDATFESQLLLKINKV